jgi:ATP-dependent DNA ligase
LPSIIAAIERLPVESVILDGEAVCLLPDGRPDFGALRSKHSCREARLIAFDLLGLNDPRAPKAIGKPVGGPG